MPDKPRILVVSNRTVDSEELLAALRERAASEPVAITLLVPAAWEVSDPHGGRESACRRMGVAMAALREAGVDSVEGVLGDPDPFTALEQLWDPERFDEVIVATLPLHLSRWLGVDLPHRVERLTGRSVTHVVAKERPNVAA